MRHLKGALDYGIGFVRSKVLELVAYTDADWASDAATRNAVSGSLVMVSNGPVIFRSSQQSLASLSTTEAEFMAATVKEIVWANALLEEMRAVLERVVLRCDSRTAIRLIKNPEFHRRTKRIDIKYNWEF